MGYEHRPTGDTEVPSLVPCTSIDQGPANALAGPALLWLVAVVWYRYAAQAPEA